MKTSSAPSRKTPWGRAVSALMLALCLAACQSAPTAPTPADASRVEVADNVFNGTFADMAANDARHVNIVGGGGGASFQINGLRTK
jgi:hypothetical protein